MSLLLAGSVHWGGFSWTGNFTSVDLIAASTNALNGALLARRPDHYKHFTIVGILLIALLGGLGGGITRDILVGQVPSALTNPAYITLALAFGFLGYHLAYASGQLTDLARPSARTPSSAGSSFAPVGGRTSSPWA